jgi:hypothetical protein
MNNQNNFLSSLESEDLQTGIKGGEQYDQQNSVEEDMLILSNLDKKDNASKG